MADSTLSGQDGGGGTFLFHSNRTGRDRLSERRRYQGKYVCMCFFQGLIHLEGFFIKVAQPLHICKVKIMCACVYVIGDRDGG